MPVITPNDKELFVKFDLVRKAQGKAAAQWRVERQEHEDLMRLVTPQPGPQKKFLSCDADIAIIGGAAGGGKSFSLMIGPLQYIKTTGYECVTFRRTSRQIMQPGGLWSEAGKIYSRFAALPRVQDMEWVFREYGSKIVFGHLEHEDDKFSWDGAQICRLQFDQLEHFTASQFWYLWGRNRSSCGIRCVTRATCNPRPDSWIREMIDWWLDENGEFSDPKKSGVIRWFVREEDAFVWADTKEALEKKYGTGPDDPKPISFTFIPAKISDNPILTKLDPNYLSKLMSQPESERRRLVEGSWKATPLSGLYFKNIQMVERIDEPIIRRARAWDLAGTEKRSDNNPDWTVGIKGALGESGTLYVEDVVRFRDRPRVVRQTVIAKAIEDGRMCRIRLNQDPGQAGKDQSESMIGELAGYIVKAERETGDKVIRSMPLSSQVEIGRVKMVRAAWNNTFLGELRNFPEGKDDQVDAFVSLFDELVGHKAKVSPVWGGADPKHRELAQDSKATSPWLR